MHRIRLPILIGLAAGFLGCRCEEHPPTAATATAVVATVTPTPPELVSTPTATATPTATVTPPPSATASLTPVATATPTPIPTTTPGDHLSSTQLLQPGPAGVGVTTMTLVDTSRPTMANGSFPGSASRRLVTEIWYPTDLGLGSPGKDVRNAPFAQDGQRHPLIVYSHGFMDMRTGGTYLARHLASYGYVVASADYPLTSFNAPGGANAADVVNQPADVSFLIDQLLALDADPGSRFAGTIDVNRIGLAGLSLGGMTTSLAAFHMTLRDSRVRAAAPIAGPGCFFGPGFYSHAEIPLLILHGSIDAIVPYEENAVHGFAQAPAPKYLVTIIGGSHTAFTHAAGVLFATANNADDVGCSALGGGRTPGDSETDLLESLGGPEAGIIEGDCPLPCADPTPRPRAVRPARQFELTILSVFPFFEAYLRESASARQFLEETLVQENLEITAQVER